ncbi:MAG TPA: ABC transporter permease, partial [Puia sp.]
MLRTILQFTWRSLTRNKLHTAVNAGGLTIGFTIGLAVLLLVYGQLSFDSVHKKASRIYEAYMVTNGPEGQSINSRFDYPAGPVFRAEAPAIARTVRFMDGGAHLKYKDKVLDMPMMVADEDIFKVFTISVVKGDAQNPLGKLTDVVLTEDAARTIFGNADPIGQELKASSGDKLQAYTVSAVVKSLPLSSVRFDMLTRIENRSDYSDAQTHWDSYRLALYIELKPGATREEAERQLKNIDHRYQPDIYRDLAAKGAKPDRSGDLYATRLLPLREAHFSTRVNGNRAVSYMMIYTLLLVGLLVIAIASFNFVNINLASAFMRGKEIGVRKCLGAGRSGLFLQLWSECFMVCSAAFVLSVLLTNALLFNADGIQQMGVPFSELMVRPGFMLLAFALLLFVSFVAGGYPSLVMSRFDVVGTLKGKLGLKRKSGLRSGLIVVQFVIACVMIGCTLVVYRQFRHLQEADTGMDKDFVISVPLRIPDKGKETIDRLRMMLGSDPHVVAVTGSNINLGRGADHRSVRSHSEFDYKGKSVGTDMAMVGYDYAKTLGIKMVAGRDFDRGFGTDTADNVLISE